MKKAIWWIIIVILVLGLAYIMFILKKPIPEVSADCQVVTGSSVLITYTAGHELTPRCVKVNSGTTIAWKNKSSGKLEVGANPHPIHTGNKEVSGGKFVLVVEPGQTGSATVSTKGTFGYHDHEYPNAVGVIVVQ
jgi:plastocyanin